MKKMTPLKHVCLIAVLCVGAAGAAQPQRSPGVIAADELYKAQKWTEAALAYEAVVKAEPANGRAWSQLGNARLSLQQHQQAIAAFLRSLELTSSPVTMYNLACAYARSGQKPQALEWLSKAVSSNLPGAVDMKADADLASLRDDPVFKDIVLAHEKRTKPCMFSPESRQFDFWVGDWAVFNPQGQRAGTSRIEQFAVGCGILENWTSTGGGAGKSINFYDPNDRKWHQYWIGADGMPHRYSGVFAAGAMRYVGEPLTVNGQTTLSRLTFFNVDPDTVRQLAEQSTDDGKTWTIVYDFKYVRQKGAA